VRKSKNSSKINFQAHTALSFAFDLPPNREESDALSAVEAGATIWGLLEAWMPKLSVPWTGLKRPLDGRTSLNSTFF
jgi:hypothetical protein